MKVQIWTKELLKPRRQGHLYLDLGILDLWGFHRAEIIRSNPRQLPKEYQSSSILKTLFSSCSPNSHSWGLPPLYHPCLPHLGKKTGSTSRLRETVLVPPAAVLWQPYFRTNSTSLLSWWPLLFSWTEAAYRPEAAHRQSLQFLNTTVLSPTKPHNFTFPAGLKGSPASIMPRPQSCHLFNPCIVTTTASGQFSSWTTFS